MARQRICSKCQPIFNLTGEELYQEAYHQLQDERLFSSCAILRQIIAKEQKKFGQEKVVDRLGNLLATDSFNPYFLNKVIAMLPTYYREVFEMIVAFGFMHKLDLKTIENLLADGMGAFLQYPNVMRSCLVRVVSAQNDDVFFFLADRMDAKYFHFKVGEESGIQLNQSEHESWPTQVTSLIKENAPFLDFVEKCGTGRMKAWAKVFAIKLFGP